MEVMQIINFKKRYQLFLHIWFYFGSLLGFQKLVYSLIKYSALEHDVLSFDVGILLFIYMYKMDNCLNTIIDHKDNIFMA